MLGLLKRHEVEVLLKAGHKRTEVARLTGISRSSVQRISEEAAIERFDDAAETQKRRIGRPNILKGSRETISDILEKQPDLPTLHILRQAQNAGYSGGKTALYALVASLRRIKPVTMQNEALRPWGFWTSRKLPGALIMTRSSTSSFPVARGAFIFSATSTYSN